MIDLKAKPYCLSDEDIAWVQNTIKGMTDIKNQVLAKL